jgi:hypothetical protein
MLSRGYVQAMSETSMLVMDATFASTDEEYADVRALREILTAV